MITRTIINDKWLGEFSPIPMNYSFKEIHNYVKLAETIWLLPLIGDDLYEELLDQVETNTLTEENMTALAEAIYPYLGFCVAYEALPFIWAHISEIGLTKGKSEWADSISLKDITYVQSHLRTQVEARKDFLKKWFCEHNQSFPTLDQCGCGCKPCSEEWKLNTPNPMKQVYSTRRPCVELK